MFGKDVVVGDARIASGPTRRRRALPALVGATVMCVAMLGGASSAWAGAGFGITPSVPQNVSIGQTGVPSALAITNLAFNNIGETGYETDSFQLNLITLVPSCGSPLVGGDCPVGSRDPGVIVPSPLTATGRAGTACANRTFVLTNIDAAQGKYSFAPDQPIVLGPSGGSQAAARCIIDFLVNIVKLPTIDSDVAGGLQTDQKASTAGLDITAGPNFNLPGSGTGTARTTVAPAQPAITTNASANIVLGAGNLSDQATVTGLVQPTANGTVVFRLYGPNDNTCATAIYTSPAISLVLNGAQTVGTAQSPSHPPPAVGDYRWRAFYSGDANNLPISGLCNAANETTTVSAPPSTPPAAPPPPAVTPPPPPGASIAPEVCTTPPGPAPAGGKICARGTAAIRGRTGCQGTVFNVTVNGRQISRVVFALDGKVVRTLTRPNSGTRYVLKVNPRTMRNGVHRIIARTTFVKQSGTRARVLRVTFSKCARRATSPAFTG
ncbi:MAG: hypothetical protein QOE31_1271 [Solirubrobacteraceae bacterium]|jgi:hypothetical protein|nr:hypothetical protein [Solirubrobacteraceae bacterium]